MTDIPIIFSAPMVRALLEGRKTMTRRLAHREIKIKQFGNIVAGSNFVPSRWQKVKPGDRLWVRESIRLDDDCDKAGWRYAADEADLAIPRLMGAWQNSQKRMSAPSIHMPRWASRLTLVVTATKVERLRCITDADAIAEGVIEHPDGFWTSGFIDGEAVNARGPSLAFMGIWKHLHGVENWQANPEVVALTFTVHRQNIDALATPPDGRG